MLPLSKFRKDEDGGILVFFAVTLVIFLGLTSLIFDIGRLASTQSELQSYADSISLAAAAELDGRADAITRAQGAADALITDYQTFADNPTELIAADIVALTFYMADDTAGFTRDPAFVTTDPFRARYVMAEIADHTVSAGLGAAFAALNGDAGMATDVSAYATAGFSQEACNVAPVAVCLPDIGFDASSSIGDTLELNASVSVGQLLPGQIAAIDTLTNSLDGLEVCAGLLGSALNACLIAARQPETACTGRGGLEISADVSGSDVLDAINTRFGQFSGVASGLAGNSDFSAAPNVLTGLTNALGLCVPIPDLLGGDNDIGLPADDCLVDGSCALQGNGQWAVGRQAYIDANYDGTDPHPTATTRFEFFQAEIAAAATPGTGGGLGGLLGGFTPQLCAPQDNPDPKRRLMVVAGIDCLSASVDASVTTPPVQQFFEVFTLGPAENGLLEVEITACLGRGCGTGHLDTEVRDIVRLVE